MSYCRWSTDGFQCDLYCYEDVSGGFTIHVASRRHKERAPSYVGFTSEGKFDTQFYEENYPKYREWSQRGEELGDEAFDDLNLPDAGESFNLETLEEFRDKVQELSDIGFNVPAYVVDDINEEIKGSSA